MTRPEPVPPPRRAALTHRALYRALIRTAATRPDSITGRLWTAAWSRLTPRMSGSTRVTIHGQSSLVNAGYAYPAFARRWPAYNHPLVQLVHEARRASERPVVLVDVGAAVGDTVLLVLDRCPDAVRRFVCVEPDPEFHAYLSANLGDRDDAVLVRDMLAAEAGEVPSLVRTHSGTASAQGAEHTWASTLDDVLGRVDSSPVGVLKVDTDGFDGPVLAGATRTLTTDRPAVIFEWHPILIERTGNELQEPFRVLTAAGYSRFVWFDKEGRFSHVMHGHDTDAVTDLAALCLLGDDWRTDWHYDVVALHATSTIDEVALATLASAGPP